jgi:16S rRNA (guanine966-N2)-methyltransferase
MRIIAGQFRGRKLLPPEGDATRPITDRVKQSVFDIISPRIEGAVVFDLFAGTGSMGLECLSRGAAKAVFFEADRSAVARLRKNIESLELSAQQGVIRAGDLFKLLDTDGTEGPADLVFLDPPYRFLTERSEDLRKLASQIAGNDLRDDGLVVFRHDAHDTLELPGLAPVERREYGKMAVEFLGRVSWATSGPDQP